MTLQQAEIILYAAAGLAFVCWIAHLWVWRTVRKPMAIAPITATIADKSADQVRELMPKVGMLQAPPWELIGGDEQSAIFRINGSGGQKGPPGSVDLQADTAPNQTGTDITLTFNPESTRHQRPPGFIPALMGLWAFLITPLVSAGVLIWVWQHVHNTTTPAARHMVWNCLQMIHILWPPFMFLGIRLARQKMAREQGQRFLAALSVL